MGRLGQTLKWYKLERGRAGRTREAGWRLALGPRTENSTINHRLARERDSRREGRRGSVCMVSEVEYEIRGGNRSHTRNNR
jgi:hypothetical protein